MAKLYFFEGRNTGIYAESAAAARAKCKRGCGKLVKTLNKTYQRMVHGIGLGRMGSPLLNPQWVRAGVWA